MNHIYSNHVLFIVFWIRRQKM